MNRISQSLASLVQREEDPRDVIASLLLAAQDDSELRQQLLFFLRTSSVHRKSLAATALGQMKVQRESESVRTAFATLASDEGAKTALDVLRDG
jgi:hypothetical protein